MSSAVKRRTTDQLQECAVSELSLAPLKGTRLHSVQEVLLEPTGARDDRRLFVIDERGRMLNGKQLGELAQVVAELSYPKLTLTFPDGGVLTGALQLGESVSARFHSRSRDGRIVEGPFAEALSRHVGRRLQLVEAARVGVDRGARGGASLISRASVARLAQQARTGSIDGRRFRMLIEVDGICAHEEDSWVARSVRVGGAVVRFNGHVGRCIVTSRDPDSGVVDLPTLDLLGSYRRELETTEPLPLGIYGEVRQPGVVRVGDAVELL